MKDVNMIQTNGPYRNTMYALVMVLSLALLYGCAGTTSPSGSGPNQQRSVNVPHVPQFDPQATATGRSSPLLTIPDKLPKNTHDTAPLKVALLLPLSGAQAPLGQAMMNASQLALHDLNIKNVTLMPRDTAINAKQAAQGAVDDGAQIFLGPIFAANAKDVAPVAAPNNIPVLSFSTDWTVTQNHVAVLGFLPFSQVTRIVDFAAKQGSASFAILIPETPYGMAVAGATRKALEQQNLKPAIEVRFNDKNLTSAMRELSQHKFDTLILPVGGKALQSVATLLRQNDIPLSSLRILGTGLWDEDPIARSGLIEGAYYAAPDPGQRARFVTNYQNMFGHKPPRLASLAYDTTALISVLSLQGRNPTNIQNLRDPAGFVGIDGIFRIRPDNLNDRGLSVLQIRGNQAAVVDPAPNSF
jgi:branched-chain amino acid transport system substrate-binding protein